MYSDKRQRARRRRDLQLQPGQPMAVDKASSSVVVELPFTHTTPSNRRQGHQQLHLNTLEMMLKYVDFARYLFQLPVHV
jgi:hypothetical protein